MFSKKVFSLLMILMLSSCTDFLRGPKHEPESLDIPTGPLSCLKKLPDNFTKISQGEALASDVDADFKCLEAALIYFKERTVGTYKEAYIGEDFRKFFGKYFLTKNNISKNLADQLVLLKAAVVGGGQDRITKDEVAKLAVFLGVLRQELIPLLPSLKILLQKASTADQKQIDVAILSIKKAGQSLLRGSFLDKSEYTFEDLHSLAVETVAFIGIQSDNKVSFDFKKYWPLLSIVKTVLLGQQASLTNLNDWSHALNSFSDLYDLVLRKHYLLQDFKFENSADLYKVSEATEKLLNLLKDSYQIKNGPGIPSVQIDELIDRLFETGLLQTDLTASTLKDSFRTLLGRMVSGIQFRSANEVNYVTFNHIDYFQRQVRIWRHLQAWIDTLAKDPKKNIPWQSVTTSYQGFQLMDMKPVDNEKTSDSEKKELDTAINEFKGLLNKKQPVKFNLKGRFLLQYDNTAGGVSWTSLSLSNATYIVTRIMIQGYSEYSPTTGQNIVTAHELVRWYDDFKNLGLELKAFDPRSANSGNRSAKEANFFMPSSNGDNEVDFNEIYEYISMMLGGGFNSVSSFRQLAVQENCIALGTKDVFGLPFVKEKEFKIAVANHRAELFDNLPYLVGYFQKHPERWSTFYDHLIDGARVSDSKSGLLEHGDLRAFIMMLHYQESLMLAFDKNHDAFLSIPEVELAVPRFMGFLREMPTEIPWFLKSVDGWLLKHGFIYLVMEGRRPTGPDWVGYAWERMMDPLFGQETKADRVGVAQVFRNLKDELKKP